ncbi:ubiquitin carboxyl-terminal hydrolase 1-like [Mercenaria mercenaria]|uniref:ubiquitin carboxyl-terminal hydrolase 1-like n=1 Tax=Mercenaria mercenaria TaxID=6596 RepID=UPI00234F7C9B|nr:ubiquitin carboxyl-terminal hydrolase 1-like [Mercenaria mercenaria]
MSLGNAAVNMGVPDTDSTGPMKKRQRLSLKAGRQKCVTPAQPPATDASNNASKTSPKQESERSDSSATMSSVSWTDSSTSASTSSSSSKVDMRVPAVASLENFGNTCFMNSVMQVLRYTPGFLHNLALLYQDVQASEKIKRKNKKSEDEPSSFAEDNNKRCCKVVKNVYKVYRDLSALEEKYDEVASDDVMSMAVKPNKILQAIRELNPMYEGHMQHDAQEFLRCFLCYFQDAEKEVQKFYSQLPHTLTPKINPIMERFLASSNTSQETKDKIVKIVNEVTENEATERSSTENVIEAEKVKVNLFPKSEIKTETAKSPRKVQVAPKVGDTAGVVDEVNEKVTHVGASTVVNQGDVIHVGLKAVTKLPSPGEIGESAESELHDSKGKQQREKASARKDRRCKPYDKSHKGQGKNKDKSEKLDNRRKGRKALVKETNQLSIIEGFTKTYSSKKRLGMRGAVLKKSAEELFDEVSGLEQTANKDSDTDSQRESTSPARSINSDNSDQGRSCDTENKQDIPSTLVEQSESGKLKDEKSENNISKSDAAVHCKEQKVSTNSSYQDVFTQFLSALPEEDSDSVEMQSDSDNEDIVLKKKKEKELRDSPRRSPRKVASEMLRTSPRKFEISKLALTSKSESSVMTVKHRLEFSGDKIHREGNPETENNTNTSHNATASDTSTTVSTPTVKSEIVDIESEGKMEKNEESPAIPMALLPVVKLENCDYILSEDGTSVSFAYATKCLSPLKSGCRSSSGSSNYLKQRTQLSMDISDEEEFKRALAEMFNSPVKSRSKYDLIERTFQGTMMLRTRCLQCESSRERQEDFHDVSVPVRIEKSDSDTEDEDDIQSKCDLLDLIEASTEVEKLLEENKYYCDECKTYVEAERSMHYDVMPDILTLHLKRFSSETGNPSNITKINDHVDIPLNLPCLRYKCAQSCLRPDHRYRLYGIVTHSGVTLTSGHYLAYVRSLPNQPTDNVPSRQQTLIGITDNENKSSEISENLLNKMDKSMPATRRKMGVATKLPSRFSDNVIANTKVKAFESVAVKKMKPDLVATLLPSKHYDGEWFECDDETVRVFDESDFVELLSEKSGSLLGTPYLLFYHKATMC